MSEQMLEGLQAAVQTMPADPFLRLQLATALRAAGRTGEAVAHASVVLSIDPENSAAKALIAECNSSSTAEPQPVAPPPNTPEATGEDFASQKEVDQLLDSVFDEVLNAQNPDRVTLRDVGGLQKVKQRLDISFFQPIRNPELSKAYGKSAGGGLMLYGPPGCGKTYLAKAVAGEIGASFLAVGLHQILDMYIGESESNVHRVFTEARQKTPCVLFLDEIDALGGKRSALSSNSMRNAVVQLLTELDGIDSKNDDLFILAATNTPWDVDSALMRPGRFDRTLFVSPPDEEARSFIIQRCLAERPTEKLDVAKIAKKTNTYSGADIRLICDSATEIAFEEAAGSGSLRPIRQGDLDKALSDVRPSTRTWFDMARNFVTFGNLGGEYDDLVEYMKTNKLL